uniref:RIIa domain-containing protein n=1 Tax=Heliothis virescens TaxID=7102 RepID=A0A2A4K5X9_HELVI
MNELLQKHGCSNVFTVPEGLKELMSDITREVLRWQPAKMLDFIANYLSALLITREHGIMAVKILDDLCDCRPTVSEHLLQLGLEQSEADELATIIKNEIEGHQPVEGKEKVKETAILKKVLGRYPLDEEMSAKVCQVARNAYRDYWYRKNMMKKGIKLQQEEAWQKAANNTLELYKKTKPSISELQRATVKIQAAYRGYHVRRNVLKHLMPQPKKKKPSRKVEMPGPPLDIATSREIDLGPVINIRIKEDDVGGMFDAENKKKLGLNYDPTKTITHAEDDDFLKEKKTKHVGGFGDLPPKGPKFQVLEATLSKPSFTATEDISLASEREKDKPIPDAYPTHPRISFAEAPPLIIKTSDEDVLEVPEMLDGQTEPLVIPPGSFEIPEELIGEYL